MKPPLDIILPWLLLMIMFTALALPLMLADEEECDIPSYDPHGPGRVELKGSAIQ